MTIFEVNQGLILIERTEARSPPRRLFLFNTKSDLTLVAAAGSVVGRCLPGLSVSAAAVATILLSLQGCLRLHAGGQGGIQNNKTDAPPTDSTSTGRPVCRLQMQHSDAAVSKTRWFL